MAWGNHCTDFTETIDNARKVLSHYFEMKRSYTEKIEEIKANFKGDRAAAEFDALEQPNKYEAISNLQIFRDLALAELDINDSLLMEAQNISPDWQFLNLRVKLPPTAIQAIHYRNSNDRLLCLGLQQYCTDNNMDILKEGLDLTCYTDVQRQILEAFFESEEATLTRDDITDFEWTSVGGFYENVKERLTDWETYARTVVANKESNETADNSEAGQS